jgi:hypothetical protein
VRVHEQPDVFLGELALLGHVPAISIGRRRGLPQHTCGNLRLATALKGFLTGTIVTTITGPCHPASSGNLTRKWPESGAGRRALRLPWCCSALGPGRFSWRSGPPSGSSSECVSRRRCYHWRGATSRRGCRRRRRLRGGRPRGGGTRLALWDPSAVPECRMWPAGFAPRIVDS